MSQCALPVEIQCGNSPDFPEAEPFNPYGCQIRFRTNHTAATCKFRYQSSLTTTPQALSHSLKNLSLQSPSEAGWVVDTGATNHISEDFSNLSNLKPYTGSSRIVLGDGTSLPITHVGSACIASSFVKKGVPRIRVGTLERAPGRLGTGLNLSFFAMAIHLSLRVAPLDLQQGGNSRILYVHVPAARMSILVYIATAINTFLFLLTKHPLFLRSSGTGIEIGAFYTLFTLVTGGFWGKPMWGTFWVWDARFTSVFILFLIYLGALRFQKLSVEPAPISIRAGPIDIPIIKFSVNWWNTSHQPGSISRSGTSIHVPMPIPILSNFANSPFSTRILFVLETRLPIPSFLESPLTDEIEAREGIPKPSSLAESLCIHG
ncbi:hypothetical protein Leryth_022792 [Lithospermum erythrorhizon]|nr:hypothetical protein Leryth_022792 [Lithospermum erythrorhizon]